MKRNFCAVLFCTCILFCSLHVFSANNKSIFWEQKIGVGYYPSLQGSDNFWLSYNCNNKKRKFIYTIHGMYGFLNAGTIRNKNFAVGFKPSLRVIRFFKKSADIKIRATCLIGYASFKYSGKNFPQKQYPRTYKGPVLLPGLDVEFDLTERVGLRFGANAGLYYAWEKDYIYNPVKGNDNFDKRVNSANYYIYLLDFNILYKFTKNYLPNQR